MVIDHAAETRQLDVDASQRILKVKRLTAWIVQQQGTDGLVDTRQVEVWADLCWEVVDPGFGHRWRR